MSDKPYFSVVIPSIGLSENLIKLLNMLNEQTYKRIIEVLIVLDSEILNYDLSFKYLDINFLSLNKLPSEKRNIAAKLAKGEYLILIDDDAYPDFFWIENINKLITNNSNMIYGGPGILPENHNFFQKMVYTILCSKVFTRVSNRYYPENKQLVKEWPTMNFIIKKKLFWSLGGFNVKYWPGEDTEFCLRTEQNNILITYDPSLIVYHNPRSNIIKYFKQILRYGIHRSKLQKSNFKFYNLVYYLPLINLLVLGISIKFYNILILPLFFIYLFLITLAVFELKKKLNYKIIFILSSLIIVPINHIAYTLGIIIGLFSSNHVNSKKGR